MAAELEEVVVDADTFQPKDLAPNLHQFLFDRGAWPGNWRFQIR